MFKIDWTTDRTGLAYIALHICTALCGAFGLLLFFGYLTLSTEIDMLALLAVSAASAIFFVLAILCEVVVHGLKKLKFWAWVAALCIFIFITVLGILMPVGLIGIVGISNPITRNQFTRQSRVIKSQVF